MSGSSVFADPWVAAFGGSGVRCYLDVQGEVCRPTAVLPVFGSTGTSMRSLAEWFSVAASTTARGMRVVTADVEQAVSSPRSVASDRAERLPPAPGAYAKGDDDLVNAVAEVARAIRGRELPVERADRNDGYCYLDLVRVDHHESAKRRYGKWPVFRELLDMPLEWYRDASECVEVGVTVRGGTLHFQRGGGDGLLSAYDLMLYGRVDRTRARGPPARLPDVVLDARVGGSPPAYASPFVVEAVSPPPRLGEPIPVAACSYGESDGEESYDSLFVPSRRREVRSQLGHCPRASQLVDFPDDYYAPVSVLSRLTCVMVGDTWRLRAAAAPGLTAQMLLQLLRQIRDQRTDEGVTGGIEHMVVGDPSLAEVDVEPDDGFCYSVCFHRVYRKVVKETLGAWPCLHELLAFPAHFYQHEGVLRQIGVFDRGGRVHFGGSGDAVFTALDVFEVLRRALSASDGTVDLRFAAVPVGGASWQDLPEHRDEDLSCVARLILDVWGKPALTQGSYLRDVFPRAAYGLMPQLPALGYPATVSVVDGKACVLHGHVKAPGAVHTTVGKALDMVYDSGLPMCRECTRSFSPRCGDCGFQESLGHSDRCRPPGHSVSEDEKKLAWLGDALHQLDVRKAVLAAKVPMSEATIVAQRYVSASAQAMYVATHFPTAPVGRTERLLSTWFEANYQAVIRGPYVQWLETSLSENI